ncbi:hypothetical protein QWY84_09480 [Aquisalimonas lutea]|uniref:hypothetical protein n=1 Tax=Aquisalimonas lutea TaxID=1327750 RepID=UPI0025B48DCD|nr:hypothetical protein [Aquisalimonas lutea]MDN3517841.1 hypothetical protein [Aquisalimonas lutea]
MTNRTIAATLAVALPLAPGLVVGVQADTRAVYDTPNGELVVEYRDQDNMRLKWPAEESSFLLIAGGDAHFVGRDSEGWYAIPAEDLPRMAAGGDQPDVRAEPLGEEVMVAGVVGELYRFDKGDSWAGDWEKVDEVVLTDDSRLQDVGRAFQRVSEVFQGAEQDVQLIGLADTDMADLALLRSSDMELVSFENESLPDRNFSLPPNARERSLPQAASAGSGSSADDAAADGEGDSSWLGQELEETGTEARDEAASSASEEVREGIREGVKSLFD